MVNIDSDDTSKRGLIERILQEDGKEILDDELASPIFRDRTNNIGMLPAFTRQEIKFGDILGTGAFGEVREVISIDLLDASGCTSSSQPNCDYSHFNASAEIDQNDLQSVTTNEENERLESLNTLSMSRELMAAMCIRNGESRYAVKALMIEDACEMQQARARIDLAIEVNYLKALSHSHIVKIRGVFQTDDPFHGKFFFLMDRLYGTLHDKITEWKESYRMEKLDFIQKILAMMKSQNINSWKREFMKERLFIAKDIASAFGYMHEKNVIHRDIKKQNIGFDVRGNVKVFDFGLAKSLREDRLSHCNYYNLTAKVGSTPYMAPEVALGKPYNEKCDVFSFGILLYEIISLRPPYHLSIKNGYLTKVVKGGKRPKIKEKWPAMAKDIMKSSWVTSPRDRPSMVTVCKMIKVDLKELDSEESIQTREELIANMSRHSSSRFSTLDQSVLEESRHD